MATVDQCESQSSGLPSTLNLFDTFKSEYEDEKDSDEESFHLPLLDCDDDVESNSKQPLTNGSDKEVNNGETEDEILNKFETPITPDIDPKTEDKILDEIDSILDKKPEDNNEEAASNDNPKDTSAIPDEESDMDSNSKDKNNTSVSKTSEIIDQYIDSLLNDEKGSKTDDDKESVGELDKEENTIENDLDEEKLLLEDEKLTPTKDVDTLNDTNTNTEAKEEKKPVIPILCAKTADSSLSDVDAVEQEKCENVSEIEKPNEQDQEINSEQEDIKVDSVQNENVMNDSKSDSSMESAQEEEKEEVDSKTDSCMEAVEEENPTDGGTEPDSAVAAQVDETENKTTESTNDMESNNMKNDNDMGNEEQGEEVGTGDDGKLDNIEEAMEVDKNEEEFAKEDENVSDNTLNEDTPKDEVAPEDSTTAASVESGSNDHETVEKATETETFTETELLDSAEQDENSPADKTKEQENVGADKCENSNDSSKNQNSDTEDLMDISVIRDADEDNASAIAENANDARASEKSDNDNDDQEEGSEKADNEVDESEMEQEDTLLANDKDDNMDFEENSNLCDQDQDNTTSGNVSDSDAKGNSEVPCSEVTDSVNDSSSALTEHIDNVNDELSSEKSQTEGEDSELKENADAATAIEEDQEEHKTSNKFIIPARKTAKKIRGKRSISETDIAEGPNKKIRLTDRSKTEEKAFSCKNNKVKTLLNFEKFMQNKKLENKLTRSDLEQFCLQKICEAIIHKTEVGELHQTIKKQEQIIENLRKDLQQLTKQARDLDIVNKKLMNELRSQNGLKKPLVPLKITRSVGLQVKLNVPETNNNTSNRRKGPAPTPPRTPNNNNSRARTITPTNASVVRQVATSPRKTPTSTPLLSQALQSRQTTPVNAAAKRPPIRPKPVETQKPANTSVIDLTDEDDKAAKGSVKIITNKTIALSQGKSINIVPNKTVANKTISNQGKTVAVGQIKSTNAASKIGTAARTVTALPQGVRLAQTQVKGGGIGGITIPANVVTSNAGGTTQFMYVVQPGSVVTSTAGGAQKTVLLNFQPTNGVLSESQKVLVASTLNGSTVSVLPTKTTNTVQLKTVPPPRKHPAPLPSPPPAILNASLKPLLPKPHLSIRKTDTGIILQWRMPYNLDIYEAIASYQLFAYQETSAPPSTDMWRKVGDVKALALPMACTLTQFADKNKYYFAVRSVDVHKRIGAFSDPEEISL
ncbi:hypothetical protein NQ315_004153 [Exocentrus adspersus]|uniref:Activating transcription factor 7-interacting protein Fn3 domain-containing protein n=1 Tax=Exocentrus adspersus TaxID=1586481 RepID=A0AAV8W6G2_9CUCU|nr:hypothetical protein NQ315_004153 [Exocentrus adspersus]